VKLISEDYARKFLDDLKYKGHAQRQLEGLAAIVEDTDPSWRPFISELVALLPPSPSSNCLLVAGTAYGCAKMIQEDFPGPAILLYGAALNSIGSESNTKLAIAIENANHILDSAGLLNNDDIKILVRAAKERAKFDRVSQMVQDEFSKGMAASGKFNQSLIPELSKEIVSVTHDVRHKGLITRIHWRYKTQEAGGSDTDIGYLRKIDEVEFIDDRLSNLIFPAQIGCAYAIKARLDERRTT